MATVGRHFPIHHHGNLPQPTCPHTYLDAANECLDCGVFVESASGLGELCIYCCTEPASEPHWPYCCAVCAIEAQSQVGG